MMIKKILFCGAFLSATCFADTLPNVVTVLSKGTGVHLVSDDEYKKMADIFPVDPNKSKSLKQISILGYEDCAENCKFNERMIGFLNGASIKYSEQDRPSAEDGNFKRKVPQWELSFKYSGLSFVGEEDLIGYALGNTYVDGKWTGVGTYFKDKEFGACILSLNSIKATNASISMRKSSVKYDIANRYNTNVGVKGNQKSGFSYNLHWLSSDYSYMIQCVSPFYDASMKSKLIDFAKKIDDDVKLG